MRTTPGKIRFLLPALALLAAGCAFLPEGESGERAKLDEAGRAFAGDVVVPELPADPAPEDYLRHAFLASDELRQRYFEWRSAIEVVPQVSSLPNLSFSFETMLDRKGMGFLDRSTLGLSTNQMPLPSKLAAAGREALEAARAAGFRFLATKFEIQGQVLAALADYALLGESIPIREEDVELLRQARDQAQARALTGSAPPEEALRVQTELDLAENDLANLRSRVEPAAARLDALVGRAPDLPLPLPATVFGPRPLRILPEDLLRLGAERNPELAALGRAIAGRGEALSLARQAWLPDFSLSMGFNGSLLPTVGAMLTLPTRVQAIRAGIAQAEADLAAAAAAREQHAKDLAATFLLNLAVLSNDERQIALFRDTIIPRAIETVSLAGAGYVTGRTGYLQVLDARRTLLDVRLTLARLRAEREQALAAIEAFAAVDATDLPRDSPAAAPGD
jgi:outer membrane protein TolC